MRAGALEEETATTEAVAAGNAALPKRMAGEAKPRNRGESAGQSVDFSGRAGDSGSSP